MPKSKLDFGELARSVARNTGRLGSKERKAHNIIEFVESDWGLKGRLHPVQKVILKAFYGIPLDDTVKNVKVTDWRRENVQMMTEAEYLRYLHAEGRCNVAEITPGKERKFLVLACGRRSGKTEISAFITAYEADRLLAKENPQKYYGIAQGDEIKICAVATSKDQAGELYAKAKYYYKSCQRFDPYRANMTSSYTRFQTQFDIENFGRYGSSANPQSSLKIMFYSCVAKGLRGAGNIVVVLDEFAHFNNGGQNSSAEVFNAVTPSTAAFSPKDPENLSKEIGPNESKVVMISSPMGKEGFFYEKFQQGWDVPENMLCIQAPTWEVNPTVDAETLETFFLDDPRNFEREFGASFSDRTLGWIENPDDLREIVDPTLRRLDRGPFGISHYMGIDIGVTGGSGDGTAIAIGHVDSNQKIVLDHLEYLRAGEGKFQDYDRLDFEEIADRIVALGRKFQIKQGIMDSWGGIPMEQYLKKKGMPQIISKNFTPQESSDMYQNFKVMMWDKRVRLYNDKEDRSPNEEFCGYLRELLRLRAEVKSRNVVKVEAPRGDHDDRSDALIRMIYLASQKLTAPHSVMGSPGSPHRGYGSAEATERAIRTRLRAARGWGSHSSRQRGFRGGNGGRR